MNRLRAVTLTLLAGFGWLLNSSLLELSQGVLVIVFAFCRDEHVVGCVLGAYAIGGLALCVVAVGPLLLASFLLRRWSKQPLAGRWIARGGLALFSGFMVGTMLLGASFGFFQGGVSRTLATALSYLPAFCSLVALGIYARLDPLS